MIKAVEFIIFYKTYNISSRLTYFIRKEEKKTTVTVWVERKKK